MKAIKTKTTALCLTLAVLALGGWECGEPLLKDTGFDIWCGDKLCAWDVERGSIQRVPTWHRSDFGVELLGDLVVLSQATDATNLDSSCFEVALQADADEGVSLSLELDFYDDGTTEYTQPLLSDDWQTARHLITPPSWYQGLRVRVVKRGAGRAVIARIRIAKGSGCLEPPIETSGRPLGAPCEQAAQCHSGRCADALQYGSPGDLRVEQTCGSCEQDGPCGSGKRCGLEPSTLHRWYRACVVEGSRSLGARCAAAEECATGVCCAGSCSTCCPATTPNPAPCAGGATCAASHPQDQGAPLHEHLSPSLCDPGKSQGAPADACLHDSDCASFRCDGIGELEQCFLDGLPCTQHSDCLWGLCLSLGANDGHCK